MPILKKVVDQYLARTPESRIWFKDLKPLEVEKELSYIKPRPKFVVKSLRLDQKICLLLGFAYPETVFMTDMGLGKTCVSLELLSYFYHNHFIRRAFIFAPTDELEGSSDEVVMVKIG